MYYIISFFIGILIKLYDDIIDLKLDTILNIHQNLIDLIKYLIIYFSVFLCLKDFTCSFIILFSLITSHYCKPFDDSFWFYYGICIFLLIFFFIEKTKVLFEYFFIKFFFILLVPILILYEERTFVEEFGLFKKTSRMYSIFINTILILCLDVMGIIQKYNLTFFKRIVIFVNSYFMTNLFIQWFFSHISVNNYAQIEELK